MSTRQPRATSLGDLVDAGALVAVVGGGSAQLASALPGLAHRRVDSLSAALLDPAGMQRLPACQPLGGGGTLVRLAPRGHRGVAVLEARSPGGRSFGSLASGHGAERALIAGVVGRFHNGEALRTACLEQGVLLTGTGEAELLLAMLVQSRQRTLVNRVVEVLQRIVGGYSMVLVSDELAVAARDAMGFRPLWIGRLGEAHLVATASAALEHAGATALRELSPGELVVLEPGAPPSSLRPWGITRRAACAQEWLCLARADASFEGVAVYTLRQRLGRAAAAACPVPDGVVSTIPGECAAAASAFARQADLPMESVFVPPPVFAGPTGASSMLPVIPAAVRRRQVTLVHHPAVEPERLRQAVAALSLAGASGVHLRCVAPLTSRHCPYGIGLPAPLGVPSGAEDAAALRVLTGANSAAALGAEGLASALGREEGAFCHHCLGGEAPLVARDAVATPQLPLFRGGASEH